MAKKRKEKYGLKITLESWGLDGPYGKTSHVQSYETHEHQLDDQQQMFGPIIAGLSDKLFADGKAALEAAKTKADPVAEPERDRFER